MGGEYGFDFDADEYATYWSDFEISEDAQPDFGNPRATGGIFDAAGGNLDIEWDATGERYGSPDPYSDEYPGDEGFGGEVKGDGYTISIPPDFSADYSNTGDDFWVHTSPR